MYLIFLSLISFCLHFEYQARNLCKRCILDFRFVVWYSKKRIFVPKRMFISEEKVYCSCLSGNSLETAWKHRHTQSESLSDAQDDEFFAFVFGELWRYPGRRKKFVAKEVIIFTERERESTQVSRRNLLKEGGVLRVQECKSSRNLYKYSGRRRRTKKRGNPRNQYDSLCQKRARWVLHLWSPFPLPLLVLSCLFALDLDSLVRTLLKDQSWFKESRTEGGCPTTRRATRFECEYLIMTAC